MPSVQPTRPPAIPNRPAIQIDDWANFVPGAEYDSKSVPAKTVAEATALFNRLDAAAKLTWRLEHSIPLEDQVPPGRHAFIKEVAGEFANDTYTAHFPVARDGSLERTMYVIRSSASHYMPGDEIKGIAGPFSLDTGKYVGAAAVTPATKARIAATLGELHRARQLAFTSTTPAHKADMVATSIALPVAGDESLLPPFGSPQAYGLDAFIPVGQVPGRDPNRATTFYVRDTDFLSQGTTGAPGPRWAGPFEISGSAPATIAEGFDLARRPSSPAGGNISGGEMRAILAAAIADEFSPAAARTLTREWAHAVGANDVTPAAQRAMVSFKRTFPERSYPKVPKTLVARALARFNDARPRLDWSPRAKTSNVDFSQEPYGGDCARAFIRDGKSGGNDVSYFALLPVNADGSIRHDECFIERYVAYPENSTAYAGPIRLE